jgi:predicted DNA-binding transcriptional regulator AlpA
MSSNDYLTENDLEREYPKVFRVKTLQTWRLMRRGPRFVKIGRRVFYPRVEIEAYIARHTVETEGQPERVR